MHLPATGFTVALPHFRERGNFRFSAQISYLLDIRESGLFSATILLSHGFGQNGGSAEGRGSPVATSECQQHSEAPTEPTGETQQALCAKSRAASVWSVSRGETFGPGAGRQRLLRCPEGETLGPGRIDVCVNPYWVIIWRKALSFGGFAAPGRFRIRAVIIAGSDFRKRLPKFHLSCFLKRDCHAISPFFSNLHITTTEERYKREMKSSVHAYRRTWEAGSVLMYACTDSFEFPLFLLLALMPDCP